MIDRKQLLISFEIVTEVIVVRWHVMDDMEWNLWSTRSYTTLRCISNTSCISRQRSV